MNELPLEEQYEDVLQNIEFGIVQVYREHPKMTNWDALAAVEALISVYRAEEKGRQAEPPALAPLAQKAYEMAKMMCEWRLGREMPFQDEEGKVAEDLSPKPITLNEIIACLKRIRKSINFWTKQGGRQGYLTFVSQFVK